ncbi:hypothetical protein H2203_004253 [Taxawa tesnikishii (nom. ined.)]|nr:hypothetical protein H2203_004253 [Dothideales sp. JES 119]
MAPQGSTTYITLPGYISAGRVYFADGNLKFYTVLGATGANLVTPSAANPSDPNAAVNWGFVELTNVASEGLFVNISYVDFVGLPLGITLHGSGGFQTACGVSSTAVKEICSDLAEQSSTDGEPWSGLCFEDSNGDALRALSPALYISTDSSAFDDYYDNYVDAVWNHYKSTPLTIDTQVSAGEVNCTVNSTSYLNCAGDNRGYAKPTASDIFGCSTGPFAFESNDNAVHYAVVPRLCAAFDRSTLLISGGNVQPSLGPSYYYAGATTNWYSSFVHDHEVDGKGYAFSYDDVTPTDATNLAGLLADGDPYVLEVIVGGPAASTAATSTSSTHALISSSSVASSYKISASQTTTAKTSSPTSKLSSTSKIVTSTLIKVSTASKAIRSSTVLRSSSTAVKSSSTTAKSSSIAIKSSFSTTVKRSSAAAPSSKVSLSTNGSRVSSNKFSTAVLTRTYVSPSKISTQPTSHTTAKATTTVLTSPASKTSSKTTMSIIRVHSSSKTISKPTSSAQMPSKITSSAHTTASSKTRSTISSHTPSIRSSHISSDTTRHTLSKTSSQALALADTATNKVVSVKATSSTKSSFKPASTTATLTTVRSSAKTSTGTALSISIRSTSKTSRPSSKVTTTSSRASAVTAAPSLKSAAAYSPKIIATSYLTEGNEVMEVMIEEVEVVVTVTASPTAKHKRHFNQHRRGRRDLARH